MLITAHAARAGKVGRVEARAFRAVNGLPDALYPPVWLIMQFGALGAVPAAGGAAWLAGERRLAVRLLADGTATWALAKLVKQDVQRPRPAMLLADAHSRGRPPAGLGYLSGHAGVATALGAATLPHLGPAGRATTLGIMSAVALSRVYIGAHLPLDIAGGIALGTAVDAAVAVPRWRGDQRERSARTTDSSPPDDPLGPGSRKVRPPGVRPQWLCPVSCDQASCGTAPVVAAAAPSRSDPRRW